MADHASVRPSEPTSRRQLKWLLVALVLSNVVMGIFAFFLVRGIDRKYSELIVRTVPTMNDLQTLTALCADAMHCTNPALFNGTADERRESFQRAREAMERDRDLRVRLLRRDWLADTAARRLKFERAGDAFSRAVEQVIAVCNQGDPAESQRVREDSLRPAYNAYLSAITKASDAVEESSSHANEALSARNGSLSTVILGVTTGPVLVCILVILSGVAITLFIALYRPRFSDM